MKTCPHCHIQVGGSAQYCPLCQNPLVGTPEPDRYPKVVPPARQTSAVLPHRCLCAAGGGGHLRRGGLHHDRRQAYALEPAGADRRGGVLLLLRALLRQAATPEAAVQILIGTSLIVTFADYYAGWNGIAIDAIVPILCSVTPGAELHFCLCQPPLYRERSVYLLLNIVWAWCRISA